MCMADMSVFVWFGGAMLFGVVGFFVVLATIIARAVSALFGRHTRHAHPNGRHVTPAQRIICPHPGCGHANEPQAVYCARCGRPLHRKTELDAYG